MTEEKTLLLLPSWFFKRQFIVSLCIFVVSPVAMILIKPSAHDVPMVNWLLIPIVLLAMALLYPYSRYAVQWIIGYWNRGEQIIYDGSIKGSLDRKFAKLMVSLVFILVLGPLCLIVLLVKRWRQIARASASS
ncbi:hypothetical protein [Aeromonas sp. 1HA1]|uniref:hypothetical protein n=1 Tax=Aeromonas sp. 1HA1 TaxID=2699193 RepID=UPI0023DD6E1A|nr:hypothetical protein [Aeromonas sp. 1HA1]MDF2414508.1 hypothetical protein [Aeromonas sp. 1HA1]